MNSFKIGFLGVLMVFGLYNATFSLPDEEFRQKAARIHQRILTVDTHVDTPLHMLDRDFDVSQRHEPGERGAKLDFPRMREGGLDAAFFAVFLWQGPLTEEGYQAAQRRAFEKFSIIRSAIHANQTQAGLALTSADAMRLKRQGRLAIYIGVENAYPIAYDISMVQTFYDLGARYIGLTHSLNNQVADASTDDAR
ncbi:MAG TPA: membrane dipeptidase, partial [Bacteroidales bacterium]|nr:membrane dipeptidase [Bacteroidales bacterium]